VRERARARAREKECGSFYLLSDTGRVESRVCLSVVGGGACVRTCIRVCVRACVCVCVCACVFHSSVKRSLAPATMLTLCVHIHTTQVAALANLLNQLTPSETRTMSRTPPLMETRTQSNGSSNSSEGLHLEDMLVMRVALLSLSLSHSRALSLSRTHTHSHTYSSSHTHTHSHTHTNKHTHLEDVLVMRVDMYVYM